MMMEQEERLVKALELIAQSLAGVHEIQRREYEKHWPEAGERREAIVTRVFNKEDRIRQEHGSSLGSIKDWLELEDEEFIGVREREFIEAEKQRKQAGGAAGGFKDASTETGEGKIGLSVETAEGEA